MLVINGWQIFAHPLFLDQIEKLMSVVQQAQAADAKGFQKTANAKVLAALRKLILETIPSDPTRPEYRQGGTLGSNRKHWFRAKFGGQRFRLFFRYNSAAKVIVFAWVNDAETLRTYGSKTDTYAVFRSMLENDSPPDDREALLARAEDPTARKRLSGIGQRKLAAASQDR